ncbi:forespore capture DNA-binding protein RefZ [Aciduricibacillus chroicocephali]|uniref:Forespore capture DNA-binding protein RefZ n=1 Tax=Aciduricibacillus chroicocephali TaxID=3054939 RepID=A0ABY9KVM3_9BACI|nr:forespore capture DNA-binding protein RefZ [Bacillaceae bacterium 44XB]
MKAGQSKQKVMDAASALFYQKGFNGASVRDIAEKAGVNVSLISYYFKSKQGLLEYAVTEYYEAYLQTMEQSLHESEGLSSLETLKNLTYEMIAYRQTHEQMTCFIQRELSLDSVFVREMVVTYIAKENYYLKNALNAAVGERRGDSDFLLLQLKGMLLAPYLMHHEMRERSAGELDIYFVRNYSASIHAWLEYAAGEEECDGQMQKL